MATIVDDVKKLTNDISAAYAKLSEKGASMPANKNTSNLASTIDSLGGGGGNLVKTNFPLSYTRFMTNLAPSDSAVTIFGAGTIVFPRAYKTGAFGDDYWLPAAAKHLTDYGTEYHYTMVDIDTGEIWYDKNFVLDNDHSKGFPLMKFRFWECTDRDGSIKPGTKERDVYMSIRWGDNNGKWGMILTENDYVTPVQLRDTETEWFKMIPVHTLRLSNRSDRLTSSVTMNMSEAATGIAWGQSTLVDGYRAESKYDMYNVIQSCYARDIYTSTPDDGSETRGMVYPYQPLQARVNYTDGFEDGPMYGYVRMNLPRSIHDRISGHELYEYSINYNGFTLRDTGTGIVMLDFGHSNLEAKYRFIPIDYTDMGGVRNWNAWFLG